MSSLVSVDVGLNALGWAAWDMGSRRKLKGELAPPMDCGVITVPQKVRRAHMGDWWERMRWLMREYHDEVHQAYDPELTAMEWPNFRSGDAVGHAAAARDDLTSLAMAAGCHAMMAWQSDGDVLLVPVRDWKGQLPKDVVEARITRAIGTEAESGRAWKSHAVDAVGIGLFAKGYPMDHEAFAQGRGQA